MNITINNGNHFYLVMVNGDINVHVNLVSS